MPPETQVAATPSRSAKRYLIYSRGGMFAAAGLVCLALAHTLFPSAATGPGTWPIDAVVITGTLLFFGRWFLVGGSVALEMVDRQLTWRRPLRPSTAAHTWSFDDVVATRVRRRGGRDVVHVDLRGGRRLDFVCKRGTGNALAASIH